MPGLPPIKIREDPTSPPPMRLSNSSTPVFVRFKLNELISVSLTGCAGSKKFMFFLETSSSKISTSELY